MASSDVPVVLAILSEARQEGVALMATEVLWNWFVANKACVSC